MNLRTQSRRVFIYDTTLRDGTQGEGISFSAKDKVLLASAMDEFGIDYIEGGWPGSNPRDMEFFDLAKSITFHHAKICAFGSTRRSDIPVEKDTQLQLLLEAGTPVITIFGKSWLLHVLEVLNTTPEENLAMIRESVQYLKSKEKEVIYDAEHFFDGYKDSTDYAFKTIEAAVEGGASVIVLCDTNGGTQVHEMENIVEHVRQRFASTPIGVHCHNDCGLGVAVSIAGVRGGAMMVQGTLNGYGERIGNANLTSIIPNLALKQGYSLNCAANLNQLKKLSNKADELAHKVPWKQEPFVGKSAFAHKGGVHANAAKKVSHSYEHIRPEEVGNTQRILLSDMAGGSSIVMKAKELGISIDEKSPHMRGFLQRLKELENEGHAFENADASFVVLVYEYFFGIKDIFELVSYRIISEVVRGTGRNISEAVVKLRVAGEKEMKISVAESSGPVGALDSAARIAFGAHFPELRPVRLADYKVRILQSNMGTDSITQVLVKSTDGESSWWTSGADPNIIEASWEALVDSYRYKLLMNRQES